MIVVSPQSPASRSPLTNAPQYWGLDAAGLHDRYWAARGVQVVRFGDPVERRGPQFYLLLDGNSLTYFDLNEVVDRMNWFNPALVRMRLTDERGAEYSERVVTDGHHRLVRFRRVYHRERRRSVRLWITPDHRLAEAWAQSGSTREARHRLTERCRPGRGARSVLPVSITGQSFDNRNNADTDAALLWLQRNWATPHEAVDEIYEYLPGIWLHETVEPPAGVRFVGPLWIGSGVSLEEHHAIVGPGGPPDQDESTRVDPFNWDEARLPAWSLQAPGLASGWRRFTKRAFDIVAALCGLMLTAPLYPIIMLAIVLEDGWPVFFAHRRQTLGGRDFNCYKFRTMCRNAERLKAELQARNRCDGPQFFIEDDPRLLRVGRLLRRFQLDELPQFWNVLIGDMSVVGPRPSPDSENQYCPVWREARLSVRPGVTGLWQVRRTRRPQTDFQEWIRYDLEYVQRQSWRLDVWIIWKTIQRAIAGEGSHDDETR